MRFHGARKKEQCVSSNDYTRREVRFVAVHQAVGTYNWSPAIWKVTCTNVSKQVIHLCKMENGTGVVYRIDYFGKGNVPMTLPI